MLKKTLGSERVNKTRRLEYTSNCNDDSEGKLDWQNSSETELEWNKTKDAKGESLTSLCLRLKIQNKHKDWTFMKINETQKH